MRRLLLPLLLPLLGLLTLASCSTKKNTAATRFWHGFSARYNTYYNGHQAFVESFQQQEKGHKDDFTELLPLFPVAVESTRGLGKSGYETAVTKAQKAIKLHSIQVKPALSPAERQTPKGKQKLARQEYNPFLKNAWLMMAKSQFQQGEFIEAASTFAYIARHYAAEPLVAVEARIWLARCYSQIDWFYDAENALFLIRNDSLTSRLRRERDISQADILLRQGRYEEALPLLRQAAVKSGSRQQRARTYYIIAQLCHLTGDNAGAYKALRKVMRLTPPFELEFQARIMQTEVLSADGSQHSQMIARLKRMARNPKYKDLLHQVYFALGNIYLSRGDTATALSVYEDGRAKSQVSSTEKGVLLLRLGEIYWDRRRFDKAQTCYSEAIGMLNKKRSDYKEITRRSKVLDKLVPYTNSIHLQDSLQELANMSEEDRNAAIDRQIEMERKRQQEARRAKRDSAAQAWAEENGSMQPMQNMDVGAASVQPGGNAAGAFYFYNQQLVLQGKQRFQQQWGNRKNEDNWRRSNRTVLAALATENSNADEEVLSDSALQAMELADSIERAAADSLNQDENNPLKREFYLKQIPFTPEAKAASDLIIMDALHHAGVIEKDDLGDFQLAEESLSRVARQYPQYEKMSDVYYQLFLMYLRWNKPEQADRYRNLMAQHYPENDTTRVICNPNFERNMRYGRRLEDSLYTATYDAFRRHDFATVARNTAISTQEFPDGVNRPKFLFVSALSRFGKENDKVVAQDLRELVKKYPESDVSHLAGMIVKGIEAGRTVGAEGYDMGSLWSRRTQETAADDTAGMAREFQAERAVPFVCLLAYPADTLDDNRLLYAVARFNFTNFTSRTFELESVRYPGLTHFIIKGFTGYSEAHAYTRRFFAEPDLAAMARKGRYMLISEQNLKLLGTAFSYDDYAKFFDENYAPMELPDSLPLDEPPMQYYEDELPPGRQPQTEPQQEHRDDPLEADDDSYPLSDGMDEADDMYDIPVEILQQPPRRDDENSEEIPVISDNHQSKNEEADGERQERNGDDGKRDGEEGEDSKNGEESNGNDEDRDNEENDRGDGDRGDGDRGDGDSDDDESDDDGEWYPI